MMKRDPPISLQQPQLLNVTLVIDGRVDESTSPRMHFYVLSGLPVEVLNYPREAIPRHEIVQNRNRPPITILRTHGRKGYVRFGASDQPELPTRLILLETTTGVDGRSV